DVEIGPTLEGEKVHRRQTQVRGEIRDAVALVAQYLAGVGIDLVDEVAAPVQEVVALKERQPSELADRALLGRLARRSGWELRPEAHLVVRGAIRERAVAVELGARPRVRP